MRLAGAILQDTTSRLHFSGARQLTGKSYPDLRKPPTQTLFGLATQSFLPLRDEAKRTFALEVSPTHVNNSFSTGGVRHAAAHFHNVKTDQAIKRKSEMIKYLLTELGRAGREDI